VILKASSDSILQLNFSAGVIEELFDPSEVAVFQVNSDVVQELLKVFDHIFFTGSPL